MTKPTVKEQSDAAAPEAPVETKKTNKREMPGAVYTYVGKGEGSPSIINLMGKQQFVRGKAQEVTDPEILAKIDGMSTFVKGEADQETLFKIDEEAKAAADAQRKADATLNAEVTKRHRTAG
jgi:hypothetical protein